MGTAALGVACRQINALTRTPRATKRHRLYDNEFLPSWFGMAARKKS